MSDITLKTVRDTYYYRGYFRKVGLPDLEIVSVMLPDPKPQAPVIPPEGQRTEILRNARRPNLPASAIVDFLKLKRRMPGIFAQQIELLLSL